MAMDNVQLAEDVRTALGFPAPTSDELKGWAQGIVEEIQQNGSATFGTTPTHPVTGMTEISMASKIALYAGYGVATIELINFCKGIILHIRAASIVTYTTPVGLPSPPNNFTNGGTISGTNGPAMASQVMICVGFPFISAKLLAECTAIADHINSEATVEFGVIS